MDDAIKSALRLALMQQNKTLPMRQPYGQRWNQETNKLDSTQRKGIGFQGPLKQGDHIVSEYSSDRDIQYPSIYHGMSDADRSAVMMAERLNEPKYRGEDIISERLNRAQEPVHVPQEVDDRAYAVAKQRESADRSPFYEEGKDTYPAWSPEQNWEEPAIMRADGGKIERKPYEPLRGLKITPPAEELSKEQDIRDYQLARHKHEFEGGPEPTAPRRPVVLDAPLLGGKYELGKLPYNYQPIVQKALNVIYGQKTLPLYSNPITSPIGRGIDAYETVKRIQEDPKNPLSYVGVPGTLYGATRAAVPAIATGAYVASDRPKSDEEVADALRLAKDFKYEGAPAVVTHPRNEDLPMRGQEDLDFSETKERAFGGDVYSADMAAIGMADGGSAPFGVADMGDKIIVGYEHGKSPELSDDLKKRIQEVAQKHGAWYEGTGGDIESSKELIPEYKGSWDQQHATNVKGYPVEYLAPMFSNVEMNKPHEMYEDPKKTIMASLIENQDKMKYFNDRRYDEKALRDFLQQGSEKDVDFLKMSQQPATKDNLRKFFTQGERLMWPDNWQEYPNNLGKLAKRFEEGRNKHLLDAPPGVYVTGAGHIPELKTMRKDLNVIGGERAGYADGGVPDETDQEEFLREQLKGSAPQYDPEAGMHTARQAGLMAAGMVPGTGLAAAAGKFPTAEGGFEPSLKEDIHKGEYLSAGLKGLGAAGDVLQAIPVVGTAAGAALKAPLAVKLASAIAPAARLAREAAPSEKAIEASVDVAPVLTKKQTFYHGSPHKFSAFDLRKSPEGIHLTSDEAIAREYAGKESPNVYKVEANYDPQRMLSASELIELQPVFSHLQNAPIDVSQAYTGERFFQALSKQLGSPGAAAEYLKSEGVHGMSYPATGHMAFYDPEMLKITPEEKSEGGEVKEIDPNAEAKQILSQFDNEHPHLAIQAGTDFYFTPEESDLLENLHNYMMQEARSKGGKINTTVDRDPDWDMGLAEGGEVKEPKESRPPVSSEYFPVTADDKGLHLDWNAGIPGKIKHAGEYFFDTMSGQKEMDPTSQEAVDAANTIASTMTLGSGANSSPAGALRAGISFPEPLFHATPEIFHPSELRPGSHLGTEAAARHIIKNLKEDIYEPGEAPPLRLLDYEYKPSGDIFTAKDNWLGMPAEGSILEQMMKKGIYKPKRSDLPKPLSQMGYADWSRVFPEIAKKKGISTIKYINDIEDAGKPSYIVYDPENLKYLGTYEGKRFAEGGAVENALRLAKQGTIPLHQSLARTGYEDGGTADYEVTGEVRPNDAALKQDALSVLPVDDARRLDVGTYQRSMAAADPKRLLNEGFGKTIVSTVGDPVGTSPREMLRTYEESGARHPLEVVKSIPSQGHSTVIDPEGRSGAPLYVAGTTPQGKNVPLSAGQIADLSGRLARLYEFYEPSANKYGGRWEGVTFPGNYKKLPFGLSQNAMGINRSLTSDEKLPEIMAHEAGHAIHNYLDRHDNPFEGMPPEVEKELFNEGERRLKAKYANNPKHEKYVFSPQEMFAESIKGYLTDPSTFKKFNPETAKYLRSIINTDLRMNKLLFLSELEGKKNAASGGAIEDALRLAKGGGAWTRKEGQNPEGGLNAKGRAAAKREGHNLKPPAPHPKTDRDAARRRSFCARMKGMKSKLTSAETARDPDSRINKSLRVWNCADGGVVDDPIKLAKGGKPIWDKPRPKGLGKPEALSKSEKSSAKAAAKAAGRPYPNLVDNMNAAKKK